MKIYFRALDQSFIIGTFFFCILYAISHSWIIRAQQHPSKTRELSFAKTKKKHFSFHVFNTRIDLYRWFDWLAKTNINQISITVPQFLVVRNKGGKCSKKKCKHISCTSLRKKEKKKWRGMKCWKRSVEEACSKMCEWGETMVFSL